ncbi:MAG: hypothetical protein AB1600_03310 [Bacteroidota bacterium]
MKKYERMEIRNLKFGNTFYFPNDKNKRVWEVIEPNENNFDGKMLVKIVGGIHRRNIDKDTEVVFLR